MGYKQLTYKQRCRFMDFGVPVTSKVKLQKKLVLINQPSDEKFKEIAVGTDIIQNKLKPMLIVEGSMQKHKKFTEEAKSFVKEKIELDWRPDQISGYAKRKFKKYACYFFIAFFQQKLKYPNPYCRRLNKLQKVSANYCLILALCFEIFNRYGYEKL